MSLTIEISGALFERCLRALHHAPANKPSLALLKDMHGDESGFRAALELAFLAGRESVYDRIEYRVMVPGKRVPRSSRFGTIDAFRDLGYWRRNGYPDAWLERRFDKEPSEWVRVPEEATDAA